MKISDHTVVAFVPTKNYEQARAFYVDKLGLEFLSEDSFAMVLRSGAVMIRVVKVQFTPVPFTILGWNVNDIRGAVQDLAGKGVAFERFPFFDQDDLAIWTSPDGSKVAWFKDPDGNTLSISKHA